MKKVILGLSFALSMIATPFTALAGGAQDFTLHNVTGFTVHAVYIAESSAGNWGGDVLGTGNLPNDGSTPIHFTGFPDTACKFDIRLEDEAGKAWEIDGLDLCATTNVAIGSDGGKLIFATN